MKWVHLEDVEAVNDLSGYCEVVEKVGEPSKLCAPMASIGTEQWHHLSKVEWIHPFPCSQHPLYTLLAVMWQCLLESLSLYPLDDRISKAGDLP